jgi:hypothetical protein
MQAFLSTTDYAKHVADEIFSRYIFGAGVAVKSHNNWDTSDKRDFIKTVFVSFDDDAPEADSHKVSFHVRFTHEGQVEDAYALETRHGNDIGARGDVPGVDSTASPSC